jgi:hypothetical protein
MITIELISNVTGKAYICGHGCTIGTVPSQPYTYDTIVTFVTKEVNYAGDSHIVRQTPIKTTPCKLPEQSAVEKKEPAKRGQMTSTSMIFTKMGIKIGIF